MTGDAMGSRDENVDESTDAPSVGAALSAIEAQLDTLGKLVLSLNENQLARLLTITDRLDLIVRLALFKQDLDRQGLWQGHANVTLEDPPGLTYVNPLDGVKHVVWSSPAQSPAEQLTRMYAIEPCFDAEVSQDVFPMSTDQVDEHDRNMPEHSDRRDPWTGQPCADTITGWGL